MVSLWVCLLSSCSLASEGFAYSRMDDIERLWGAYSPFFEAGTYIAPPDGCQIDQVNLLQRHGARFPTSGAATTIVSALSKLQGVQNYTDARLDLLQTFTYSLGVADLVPFGAQQSFEAGESAFERYADLITEDNLPFVRASSSARVVDTANNWTAGFAAASHYNPQLSVILPENGNDTLDNSGCPNAGNSDNQTDTWLAVFAPNITARLNSWAPGANLTDAETYALISMCPFHTVGSFVPGGQLKLSPFCALFTDAEFAAFEYSMDLDKYYGTGYGAFLGRVQGVGYINELLARLTDTPVNDSTQTNTTLTNNPATFPFNRPLYADFSHDNQMAAIYSAMGLFPQATPLDPTHPAPRTWVASLLVPFSARMVVERLRCGTGTQFVRVFVNDALQPLDFCAGNKGTGICGLQAFVASQEYARSGGNGDWEMCFSDDARQ
ncbi:acid phosphatase [Mycena polygramma]|nr:acid phosphatase [Mycena polygramma]